MAGGRQVYPRSAGGLGGSFNRFFLLPSLPPGSGRRPAELPEEAGGLAEALGEFEAVLEDFACPAGRRRFHYGEHLERMKRRSSASTSDLSDSESE